MSNFTRIDSQLFAIVVALLTWSIASAQHAHSASGPAGKLNATVGSVSGQTGSSVDAPISLSGAAGLGALEFVLTYDPAVLEPMSAEKGAILSGNALIEHYPDPSGRLAVTLVCQNALSGDGVAVIAKFTVKGQNGQKCPLKLENVRAWDAKSHLDFLVTTTAGEFTVGSGALNVSWLWWIAAAVAAVVLLLLFQIGRGRQSAKSSGTQYCSKCGATLNLGAVFCSKCGNQVKT
jgi:hypothetical protein